MQCTSAFGQWHACCFGTVALWTACLGKRILSGKRVPHCQDTMGEYKGAPVGGCVHSAFPVPPYTSTPPAHSQTPHFNPPTAPIPPMDQFTDVFALTAAASTSPDSMPLSGSESMSMMSSSPDAPTDGLPVDADSSAQGYGYWCVVA
ncbi:hypothetical protein B0H10DRAFT_651338 [Mycena sp. CBHHK59/15]|nr:hypothetical protein B0H10DRAFT_651338 [Mycena sp. CBHHK59/15]